MDEFQDITSVGEVGDDQRGLEIQAEYTQGSDRLHMCYGFRFSLKLLPNRRPHRRGAGALPAHRKGQLGLLGVFEPRRGAAQRRAGRFSAGSASGIPCGAAGQCEDRSACNQGEELGLNEADIAFEDLHDPYGIRFWPAFKGRDGCRTPMVWHANRQYGGFSEAKPWLPVAEEHASRAVDAQECDPDSMLNFYRRMIAYRASRPELVKGTFDVVEADEGFLSAIRTCGRKRPLHCIQSIGAGARGGPACRCMGQRITTHHLVPISAQPCRHGRQLFSRKRAEGGTAMANLVLSDVAKSYGTVDVLQDINLDIETGELIVFVGPSGCGKSTLLRMIAGP